VTEKSERRVELLLGRKVRALDGAVIGRIEEMRAEREHDYYVVTEFLVGPIALIERLAVRHFGLTLAGRIHGYFSLKLHVWDIAAAEVILREAGGVVTNLSGGSWLHSDGAYVASNYAVHGEMLRLLKVCLPPKG